MASLRMHASTLASLLNTLLHSEVVLHHFILHGNHSSSSDRPCSSTHIHALSVCVGVDCSCVGCWRRRWTPSGRHTGTTRPNDCYSHTHLGTPPTPRNHSAHAYKLLANSLSLPPSLLSLSATNVWVYLDGWCTQSSVD